MNESEDSAQEEIKVKTKKASAKKQIEEELESAAEQNGDKEMADPVEDEEEEEGDDEDDDEEALLAPNHMLLPQLMCFRYVVEKILDHICDPPAVSSATQFDTILSLQGPITGHYLLCQMARLRR